MSEKSYLWQKTYLALENLTSDTTPSAIGFAVQNLMWVNADQAIIEDPDVREAWQALQTLMRIEPAQMSDEQRRAFARDLWRVYHYETSK